MNTMPKFKFKIRDNFMSGKFVRIMEKAKLPDKPVHKSSTVRRTIATGLLMAVFAAADYGLFPGYANTAVKLIAGAGSLLGIPAIIHARVKTGRIIAAIKKIT